MGCCSIERTRMVMFKKKKEPLFGSWRSKLGGGGEGTSFSEEGFCFMCVSACDSKLDNVLLLLACYVVYDDDANPSGGQLDNPPHSDARHARISVRQRLPDRMEWSWYLLHAIYCFELFHRKSPANARSWWPIHITTEPPRTWKIVQSRPRRVGLAPWESSKQDSGQLLTNSW